MDDIDTLLMEADVSDEDVQEWTSAQVIENLEEAWMNEKFAPEILPNRIDLVECLLGQIKYMEENLRTLDTADFKKSLHLMEVDRIRYLVASYLRNRLEKIETYVLHILKQEEQRTEKGEERYLTEAELKFAQSYKQGLIQHFEDATSFYPGLPTDDWKTRPIAPNIHSFVFLESKKNVEGVVIDDGRGEDGDVVDLNPGSRMIISYSSVADLVNKGDVQLI